MSLLEKAQSEASNAKATTITPEHIELAHAFTRGEVGVSSVNVALGYPKRSMRGYITVARALRHECMTEKPQTKEELDKIVYMQHQTFLRHSKMTQEEIDEELKIRFD